MSGVDFIGAIEPWPSSHAMLPDGWSWGDTPTRHGCRRTRVG